LPELRRDGERRPNGAAPDRGPSTDTLVPAVCIYLVVGLSVPVMLAIILHTAMQPVDPARLPPPGHERDAFLVGRRIGQFLLAAMFMVCYGMELIGAYHLHAHRSRTLALIGAMLCCVPCLSPCLVMGIPFGIWALVVLNMGDVKEQFG
jgi:hypothetical protein